MHNKSNSINKCEFQLNLLTSISYGSSHYLQQMNDDDNETDTGYSLISKDKKPEKTGTNNDNQSTATTNDNDFDEDENDINIDNMISMIYKSINNRSIKEMPQKPIKALPVISEAFNKLKEDENINDDDNEKYDDYFMFNDENEYDSDSLNNEDDIIG